MAAARRLALRLVLLCLATLALIGTITAKREFLNKKPARCTKEQLKRSPCQNNATCDVQITKDLPRTEVFTCTCQKGYVGIWCDKYSCSKYNPCLNKGKCKEFDRITSAGATCTCTDKYTGARCESTLGSTCKKGKQGKRGVNCVHGKCKQFSTHLFKALPQTKLIINGFNDTEQEGKVCVCEDGYHGKDCSAKCMDNKWGYYCSRVCNVGCKTRKAKRCDRKTGKCLAGCEKIYSGKNCITRVDCKEGKTCLHGICIDPRDKCYCKAGYYGPTCAKTCAQKKNDEIQRGILNDDVHYYGKNCSLICSQNCFKQPCNSKSGECEEQDGKRCKEPWSGIFCNETTEPLAVVGGSFSLNYAKTQESSSSDGSRKSFSASLEDLRTDTTKFLRRAISLDTGIVPFGAYDTLAIGVIYQGNDGSESVRVRRQAAGDNQGQLALDFNLEFPAENLALNEGELRSRVTSTIRDNSNKFTSDALPGLSLNKDSVVVTKVGIEDPTSSPSNSPQKSSGTFSIVGGAVAGLCVLVLFSTAVIFIALKRQRNTNQNTKGQQRRKASSYISRKASKASKTSGSLRESTNRNSRHPKASKTSSRNLHGIQLSEHSQGSRSLRKHTKI